MSETGDGLQGQGLGATPTGSGHSPKGGAAKASPAKPSVPSAERGLSLTQRRLDAIRNALSYRLASPCPGDKRDIKDYREALTWATAEAAKRGHIDLTPRPLPNVVTPSPLGMSDYASGDVRVAELANSLTPLEKQLLLGECDGWGSWMFTAGSHLCSIGLGTKRDGSIYFDTPLAKRVIAALATEATEPRP